MTEPVTETGILVVTSVRNEGPFLLEWIAYNRALGVGEFIIYSNDSVDGTAALLHRLDRRGVIRHVLNPYRLIRDETKPQQTAIIGALDYIALHNPEIVAAIDVDEFVAIHVGKGTLADLFDAVGPFDAISLVERRFSACGHTSFADDFVIRRFTEAEPATAPHGEHRHVKTFMRVRRGLAFRNHRPMVTARFRNHDFAWFDGAGQRMSRRFVQGKARVVENHPAQTLAQLNHYGTRDEESFRVKRISGRGSDLRKDPDYDAYWRRFQTGGVEDRSAQRLLARMVDHHDWLMSDPETRRLHDAAVKAFQTLARQELPIS